MHNGNAPPRNSIEKRALPNIRSAYYGKYVVCSLHKTARAASSLPPHNSEIEVNAPDGSTMTLNWIMQGLKIKTVTLTELPIIMSGAAPMMVAIYSGIEAGGLLGALIGGVVGLAMGIGNVFGELAANRACRRWYTRCKELGRSTRWPENVGGLFVLVGFIWAIASGVLAMFITKWVIQSWL
jgi:hypothetical protein